MKQQYYRNGEQAGWWSPGVKKEMVSGEQWLWLEKGDMRDFCGDGAVLYVCILAVTLLCGVTRCHLWEKLGKEYMGSLCIIA